MVSVKETKKSAEEPQTELKIELTVQQPCNRHATRTIRFARSAPLSYLLDVYCKQVGAAPGMLKLMFDGITLNLAKSAEENDLEDGDAVDAIPLP